MKTDSTFSAKAGRGWLCFRQMLLLFILAVWRFHSARAQNSFTLSLPQLANGAVAWADIDGDNDLDVFIAGVDTLDQHHAFLLRRDSAGYVQLPHSIPAFRNGAAAFADLDNDGDSDLVVAGQTAARAGLALIFSNNGSGSFSLRQNLGPMGLCSLVCADFNHDGGPDILVCGTDFSNGPTVKMWRNNGLQSFTAFAPAGLTAFVGGTMAVADFNQDGWVDVYVRGFEGGSGTASLTGQTHHLYKNLQFAGGFGFVSTSFPELHSVDGSVSFGRFNNDALPDLLFCGLGSGHSTRLYVNSSSGFSAQSVVFPGIGKGAAVFGDYDGDGFSDVALVGKSGGGWDEAKIYRNNGAGGFILNASALTPGYNPILLWGDADWDGDLDLLVNGQMSNHRPFTHYYENNNGTFTF